jgi:hypothetical protein
VKNKVSPQQAAGNEIQKRLKAYRILTHQYWRNSVSKSKLTLSASLCCIIDTSAVHLRVILDLEME